MVPFLPSLILVLVAQVPLLLKFWLDYKSKTIGFKQLLYGRQLDAFQTLMSQLTKLHWALQSLVSICPDKDFVEDDSQELAQHIYKSVLDARSEFDDGVSRAELLLPAGLSGSAANYKFGASRILECALNLPTLGDAPRPDIKALWSVQQDCFNKMLNEMRLAVGIDALTSEVFREVHASGKATILEWKYGSVLEQRREEKAGAAR